MHLSKYLGHLPDASIDKDNRVLISLDSIIKRTTNNRTRISCHSVCTWLYASGSLTKSRDEKQKKITCVLWHKTACENTQYHFSINNYIYNETSHLTKITPKQSPPLPLNFSQNLFLVIYGRSHFKCKLRVMGDTQLQHGNGEMKRVLPVQICVGFYARVTFHPLFKLSWAQQQGRLCIHYNQWYLSGN